MATLASCLVLVPQASAQSPPDVSDTADRPGFADSAVLLGHGHVQIESGFTWEHEGRGVDLTKTFTWPQLELHGGLAPWVEVSLAWDGLVSTDVTTDRSDEAARSTGGADVRLGTKIRLLDRPGGAAALIGYVDLPVGSADVSSGFADPLVRVAWTLTITDRLGLSGTADLGAERESERRVRVKPAVSGALGATLVGALSGYVGVVAESPPIGSTPDVWSTEGGVMLKVGARTQLDVWASRRVAGGPHDWALGAGVVRRLR